MSGSNNPGNNINSQASNNNLNQYIGRYNNNLSTGQQNSNSTANFNNNERIKIFGNQYFEGSSNNANIQNNYYVPGVEFNKGNQRKGSSNKSGVNDSRDEMLQREQ